jgi:hypothetical protein
MYVTIPEEAKPYNGHVIIPDALTIDKVLLFSAVEHKRVGREAIPNLYIDDLDAMRIPVILKIVTEWKIDGVTDAQLNDNLFPVTPRPKSRIMIETIWNAIQKVYLGETEIPNA